MSDQLTIRIIRPPRVNVTVPAAKNLAVQVRATIIHQGPPGEKGDPGGSYTHSQLSPASIWNIPHNLGYNPGGIRVFDSANEEWYVKPVYLDSNNIQLDFSPASFSGTAYLS